MLQESVSRIQAPCCHSTDSLLQNIQQHLVSRVASIAVAASSSGDVGGVSSSQQRRQGSFHGRTQHQLRNWDNAAVAG